MIYVLNKVCNFGRREGEVHRGMKFTVSMKFIAV